jgi:hypothetical protein
MKETDRMIVIFGHYDWRFDVPKSKIIAVGRNVILGMDYPEIFKYRVDRNRPLPTGEAVEQLDNEETKAAQSSTRRSNNNNGSNMSEAQ